jgi:DNA repair exonuclease SbcCD nuclease subunit
MKKALIVTDLHLRPSTLEMNQKVLSLIEEKIEELKPDYLINLGDTFHTKNNIQITVQNEYQNFIEKISKKVKVINLVGNHDWGIQYSEHPFNALKFMPNVTVVEDVFTLGKCAFISYCRETTRFQEMLERAGHNIERVFAHMDMNGFTPGSGWEEVSPFFDPEYFKNYKQIISGHLHLAQNKTLSSGTEIIFVGSAYTTDFGESDQEKRFLYMDLDTGDWESIPTGMTMHKTFKIKAGEAFPEIPKDEVNLGVRFRVIVSGTKEQINTLILPKRYDAQISYDLISAAGARIELSATDNQDQTMRKYIEAELKRSFGGVEKSGLDIDKLIKIGKKFIPNG